MKPVVEYRTIARISPSREVVGQRPKPTRVVACRAGTGEDGSGWIPALVFVEQVAEDTYTPAAAEKLGKALIAAAKWATPASVMVCTICGRPGRFEKVRSRVVCSVECRTEYRRRWKREHPEDPAQVADRVRRLRQRRNA